MLASAPAGAAPVELDTLTMHGAGQLDISTNMGVVSQSSSSNQRRRIMTTTSMLILIAALTIPIYCWRKFAR